MSVNVCVFNGNVTRDPEVKDVGETKVAKFGLAVNRFVKGEKKVSFLDMEVWGKQADFVQEFVRKGSSVTVSAEARQDVWEDKDTKDKRSKIYFTVDRLELHGKGNKAEVAETAPKSESVPF